MIKWIHFYETNTGIVKTLFTENGFFQDNGQTHMFTDAQDALSKNTPEAVVFWDGQYIGVGTSVAGQ